MSIWLVCEFECTPLYILLFFSVDVFNCKVDQNHNKEMLVHLVILLNICCIYKASACHRPDDRLLLYFCMFAGCRIHVFFTKLGVFCFVFLQIYSV